MKTNFRFLVLAIAMIAGISASAQKRTPLELNNYFASINDTLYAGGKAWGAKLNTVAVSKSFDSLAPFRVKLEKFIERKTAEISSMKDIGGSEDFRKAMLGFLAFEARMIKEGFVPIEKLPKTVSQEELRAAINKLIEVAGNETSELEKVNDAQYAYAEKNGFSIEKKDE